MCRRWSFEWVGSEKAGPVESVVPQNSIAGFCNPVRACEKQENYSEGGNTHVRSKTTDAEKYSTLGWIEL